MRNVNIKRISLIPCDCIAPSDAVSECIINVYITMDINFKIMILKWKIDTLKFGKK